MTCPCCGFEGGDKDFSKRIVEAEEVFVEIICPKCLSSFEEGT